MATPYILNSPAQMAAFAVVLISLGPLASSRLTAAAAEDGFSRGNRLYAAGKYAEAVVAYEGQVRQAHYHANLFYNLGDAYFRVGDRGRAIVNYQRALLLEPVHAEAAANLAFVNGSLSGAESNRMDAPSGELLPWLTAAAVWLAAGGILVAIFLRRRRRFGTLMAVAGACMGIAGTCAIWWMDRDSHVASRAFVIADGASARYSPADNSKAIRQLPIGASVRVLSTQGAWLYTALEDGTRGWIASDKVQRIVPTP